ncbi:crotonase/enoyl-CoA hydratase family protein [Gordonia rhizosphera]|uniref:Probable enoyl-CoA hydratase EchA17 n=1 Tax=Gordonia rhizosphera NBRC 16068 TaxID=1108045 RepID=K6WJB7_9ACTN|nr:crotonase/enoyl-CoA hydratase family protein [Gordonia rhizosphera]GAB92257.1 enoyl-CoA hydratase [Gordonia rhizosphera NBRC 16068]
MTQPDVHIEQHGRVLQIIIDRPEARNAINRAVSLALAAAIDRLDDDPDLSVAVIGGTGGSFSAGMDLKAFARGEDMMAGERGLGFTGKPPIKPMIAAVEGYALGGGCELALAADMIVAGRTARFGLPEVKRGLVAGGGGLLRLPQRIPRQFAMEMVLTGMHLTADRAHELGLVNRVTDDGEALAGAMALAQEISENGPLAIAASKRVIVESQDWSTEVMFDEQAKLVHPVFTSADAREGALAFAERRTPQWRGV